MVNRLASVLITLLMLTSSTLFAQNAKAKARLALSQLKEGVLIVRIPSNQNKIDALNKLLARPDLPPGEQQRLAGQLEATKKQTQQEARIIQSSFANYYEFSELLYMYDKDTEQLTRGKRSGLFLDEKLMPSAVPLKARHFFFVDVGYTDPSSSARSFALIIKDRGYKSLVDPFPYAQRINTTGWILDQLAGKNNFQKYFRKAVIRLNKRLLRAYKRG